MANSIATTNQNPQLNPRRKRRGLNCGVKPDLTPMIDCVFQLIIFFMLTAQMASQQTKMILPGPTDSQAVTTVDSGFSSLVINMPNSFGEIDHREDSPMQAGRPTHIVIAGLPPITVSNHALIKKIIRDRMATSRRNGMLPENYFVEFRVDKDIHWRYVKPLMQVASEAGAAKVVFTALTQTTE